jgi:type III secretory pathway lipoprotein EscJ
VDPANNKTVLQPASEVSKKGTVVTPNFTEEDLYYINGLTKQIEVHFSELEGVMGKKANIVYRAMKLHLKKKPSDSQSSASQSAAGS